MKKRILYIILATVALVATFLIGRETAQTEIITVEKRVIPENYIDVGDIVDWNTDGEELSISTGDGSEYYAYKTANIYKHKSFIPK